MTKRLQDYVILQCVEIMESENALAFDYFNENQISFEWIVDEGGAVIRFAPIDIDKEKMLNIIEINNFNAPELDVYARYTEAQLLNKDRPEDGLFIAESPKVIDGRWMPDIFQYLFWLKRNRWKKMKRRKKFLQDLRIQALLFLQQSLLSLRN